MPFAAVLTRSSCCFYFRLLRFHARNGISGRGLCPVTLPRHLANLQARIHSVKESRFLIYERAATPCLRIIVVLHSGMHWATWTTLALCRGICLQWRCCLALRGMAAPMIRPLMRILPFILGYLLAAIALPNPLHAQLVRENAASPPPQVSAKQDAHNAASTQPPQGKKRLSHEVQLTGQESWIDTGIDVQAGEHALVTASGKLRYADAKDDNVPDGLPRGFKDLLRVLPYNEGGRGALIGPIGDKDMARPFVLGARRDVVAPVSVRLSVGINQTTDDTGDGTYVVHVEVYVPEGAARVVAKQVSSLPGIDNHLFSNIPRRVADKDGNAGDMV